MYRFRFTALIVYLYFVGVLMDLSKLNTIWYVLLRLDYASNHSKHQHHPQYLYELDSKVTTPNSFYITLIFCQFHC